MLAAPCVPGDDVSRLQVIGDLLGLSVLIDDAPADPDGDGFIVVEPGVHNVKVIFDATGEVIFDEDITVPSCLAAPTPTPTPVPTPTPTPVATPTPTPTPRTAWACVTATPTLPPTDTFGGPATPTNDGWRVMLVVMAGILASVLILTPKRASRRR